MNPLREAAQQRLAHIKGAFLRCDRGNALYITNAALRSDEVIDWAAAGFDAQMKGKMTFLIPQDRWIAPLKEWLMEQGRGTKLHDAVCNADFGEIQLEDRQLLIDGIKQLEIRTNLDYEKAVRQRAAVCLRTKRGGGTIGVCALIAESL